MPLFTHMDRKAWHTLSLDGDLQCCRVASNEYISNHVDDVDHSLIYTGKMGSQMFKGSFNQICSFAYTCKAVRHHIEEMKHLYTNI